MRIVIDMQGAQTDSRYRGIGRYTLSFTRAVIRQARHHEIILALNGQFPESVRRIRQHFAGLLPPQNIVVWQTPGVIGPQGTADEHRQKAAEHLREAFLASLAPDVIHINSLFEGFSDEAIVSIGELDKTTPVSVIIYDLIPLLNPDQYLKHNKDFERHYRQKVTHLTQASRYFSISEFAKQEAVQALGVNASDITNIFGAIDESLQNIKPSDLATANSLKELGINRPYILHTGGGDERKNLPRLIQAFSKLPPKLRSGHQLVFAGRMSPVILAHLQRCAKEAGLQADELIFTKFITDAVLARLYTDCALYVFPSRHEGLGLPAMEAMAFNAPVIAAKTSSLPEVIDNNEALFDPFDVEDMCAKIRAVLENTEFRQALVAHGKQRAQQFSWDESARRAIDAWEQLASHTPARSNSWSDIQASYAQLYRTTISRLGQALTPKTGQPELQTLALCLAHNEQQAFDVARRKPLTTPIQWRLEGPFDSSYSLALVNREVARGLRACGHSVSLHSTEGPGDFLPSEAFLAANPDINELYQRSLLQDALDVDVTSRNLYPPRVLDLNSRLNFLHTYGWEESGFPMQWANDFNQALQGMTVMSEHVRKIMIDHGVTVPIAISALGVDHWDAIVPDPDYRVPARSFRFLHVSSCFPRKGVDVMLRAYGQAFSVTDDVTLIIKTFKNPHNEVQLWLEQARGERLDFPDVLIIEEDFSDSTLKALYEQCHALVAPSKAEGFGLPMAEAMLSNLAVITTAWGGQADFCTPDTAWLIDYSFARAQTHFELSCTAWAEPDQSHLASLMKEVYGLPQPKRSERILAGQQLLRNHFTWKQVATRMVRAANACAAGSVMPQPRIGWISTWNTRCGIASYSEQLVKHMPAEVTVLAAQADARIAPDSAQVNRCWQVDDDAPLLELLSAIEQSDVDVVVIQFNYGFFNFDSFNDLVDQVLQAGHVVVVTLHSTIDPPALPHKTLQKLASTLARCDRVLVHSHADLNRLKQVGLTHNVTLFPHGVIQSKTPLNPPQKTRDEFVLASYGFFLPQKGLIELIEAFAMLRAQGMPCRLVMANAQYPIQASEDLIAKARERITELGLIEQVSLCTDYLEDEQSLQMLAQADLVVFPYSSTGESSSAAVRFGIASGRPVAVTPLPIFSDVQAMVHQLPGTTPKEIAQGIAELARISDNFKQPFVDQQARTQQWLQSHDYRHVAQRLHGLVCALHAERSRTVWGDNRAA